MPKIRVGYDCRDLFFAQTGTRTFSEELLREIEADPEVELVRIAPQKGEVPKGYLAKFFSHFAFIYWKVVSLPIAARRAQVEYLICPDYVAPAWFFGKIKTMPVFHGCNIWELPQNYNAVWRLYFSFLAKMGERKAYRILTVSGFSKQRLQDVLSIQAEKILVIPLGPKQRAVSPTTNEADTMERPLKDRYLLHVGILDKRKNIPALVSAFALLNDPTLHLVLAGGRPTKVFMDGYPDIRATIEKAGLTHRVHLAGFVRDEELPAYYTHAEAYVFPSLYEGFGIPIIEAYHYGLPTAAARAGALPEVVGRGGILFDGQKVEEIAAAIKTLLQADDAQLERWRQAQQEQLDKFNWSSAWKAIKSAMYEG